MYSIGIDAHKKYLQVSVLDTAGHLVKRQRVVTRREDVAEALKPYAHEESKAVFECGRNNGLIYDLVSSVIDDVRMAHTLKVRAIAEAKIKTDTIDADTLAYLLRADLIPECFIRNKDSQQIQRLLRQRLFFVRLQTMIKNRIHNLVDRQENIREETATYSDLFSEKGIRLLRQADVPAWERRLLNANLDLLQQFKKQIESLEILIAEVRQADEVAQRIMTIPGIGNFFSMLIRYEIDDISRFKTSDKLCSYAGLIPSTYSSGGKTYHGRLIKQGNKYLRWAMIEAVIPAVRSDESIRSFYNRLKVRKGTNRAKVATARRLLKIVYQVWKDNRAYQAHFDARPL